MALRGKPIRERERGLRLMRLIPPLVVMLAASGLLFLPSIRRPG